MSWTQKDLDNLKAKGLKVNDIKVNDPETIKPKVKIEKISIEKRTIEFWLDMFKKNGLISDFVTEYQFNETRKFRFDWAIIDLKIAIEFEGIMSKKSRHTTVTGYSKDAEKYNLAQINGWTVLRYTVLNYKNLEKDLRSILNNQETKIVGYCRLFENGAIIDKCATPCNSCITASPDQLLKQNFVL